MLFYIILVFTLLNIVAWLYGLIHGIKSLHAINVEGSRKGKSHLNKGTYEASIIIPVRNEEDTIGYVLDSVARQKGVVITDVIVLDDSSTDSTIDIALNYRSKLPLKIVKVTHIPGEWSPKPYLYYRGYMEAKANILVFLDGDTWFTSPYALKALIDHIASTRGVVSYAPRFYCRTIRCKLVETLLTTFSHAFLGFDKVFDSRKNLAWYYGCCWGIRREVYEEAGTHKVVYRSIVEDRDFAEYLKKNGYEVKVVYGGRCVATMWYDSIGDTVKVLARVLRRHGLKRFRSLLEAVLIALSYYLPFITLLYSVYVGSSILLYIAIAQYILLSAAHVTGAKHNRYSILYSLTAPLLGIVLALGVLAARNTGNIVWKGRVLSEKY